MGDKQGEVLSLAPEDRNKEASQQDDGITVVFVSPLYDGRRQQQPFACPSCLRNSDLRFLLKFLPSLSPPALLLLSPRCACDVEVLLGKKISINGAQEYFKVDKATAWIPDETVSSSKANRRIPRLQGRQDNSNSACVKLKQPTDPHVCMAAYQISAAVCA